MSIRIMSKVWENGPDDKAELLVMLALSDFSNDAGECWPSVAAIGTKARMSERNARRILRKLEDDGYLVSVVGGGRFGCSKYRINPDKMSPGQNVPPGQNERNTRTKRAQYPDIAMSAEPSRTIIEPKEPPFIPPLPKPRRKPEVPLPPDWVPSDRNIADAEARQFSAKEINNEANRFRDHHLARGTLFRDWDAAWRTWLGNARNFTGRGMAGKAGPGGYGQGSSLASIVARRRADGAI